MDNDTIFLYLLSLEVSSIEAMSLSWVLLSCTSFYALKHPGFFKAWSLSPGFGCFLVPQKKFGFRARPKSTLICLTIVWFLYHLLRHIYYKPMRDLKKET